MVSPDSNNKLSFRFITGICVAIIVCLAFALRVIFPYDYVFSGQWIKFTGTDAYFHMWIVDNIVHNFPSVSSFNPYLIYPGGGEVTGHLFFDYLLAAVIWLIGLGAPTQHTIDIVSVYFPAILGALVVIPTYFIGKALCNRWCGIIAAALIAFLPGEFLGRSILGFTDNHVFEVLCSTLATLFVILAVQSAKRKQLSFSHLIKTDWHSIAKPLIYSVLAGITLALYLNSWQGALLFVFIFFIYIIIQYFIDYARSANADYLCFAGSITFITALILTMLFPHTEQQIASLLVAVFATLALGIMSHQLMKRGLKPFHYVLIVAGAGILGLAIFYLINQGLLTSMISLFSWLNPSGGMRTISETAPIFFPDGEFTFSIMWLNFTTGSILAFIALGMCIYIVAKRGDTEKTLLVVWSVIILLMTLSMRRWAYYFAVNVALLTAYCSWWSLERYFGFKKAAAPNVSSTAAHGKKAKHQKRAKKEAKVGANTAIRTVGAIVVFLFVILPNVIYARDTASQPRFAPGNAWCESLDWMKNNTPEPFGSPDFYNKLHRTPFTYPETVYSVTAWWDYGYWIPRISHRIPNCNPGQGGAEIVGKFLTSQDENTAATLANNLKSKYVILDYETVTSKFYALTTWAGSNKENYYDIYYQTQAGKSTAVMLFYPEYYRSLAVRLYNFDGKAVIPRETMVISYEEKTNPADKQTYKLITGVKTYPTYNEALSFIQSQQTGKYRIVSSNPFASPIPLDELNQYKPAYSSKVLITTSQTSKISEVKIFEYTPP